MAATQVSSSGSSGSSGSGLGDMFTTLGNDIQHNSEEVIKDQYAEYYRKKALARQALLDEQKRQENQAQLALAQQNQGLKSMDFLAGQRQNATNNARSAVQTFHNLLG